MTITAFLKFDFYNFMLSFCLSSLSSGGAEDGKCSSFVCTSLIIINSEGVFLVAGGGVSQYACSFPVPPDLQWLLFCS